MVARSISEQHRFLRFSHHAQSAEKQASCRTYVFQRLVDFMPGVAQNCSASRVGKGFWTFWAYFFESGHHN
jgi:hypothetical protein